MREREAVPPDQARVGRDVELLDRKGRHVQWVTRTTAMRLEAQGAAVQYYAHGREALRLVDRQGKLL